MKQKWEEKQMYEDFKRPTPKISFEKTKTWLRKGRLLKETESLLIAAQNNDIRTNYIKAKIDYTPRISKFQLCREKDETVNYINKENVANWHKRTTRVGMIGRERNP